METAEAVGPTPVRAKYVAINDLWPASLPPMTAVEAIKAFRMLYKHRFHKKWVKPVLAVKGAHRRTWTDNGNMIVAPDQGWHDFIHDISHWAHRKQYPNQNPHKGSSHAAVERDLIEEVLKRGWLDGRLKTKIKAREPEPAKEVATLEERAKAWLDGERDPAVLHPKPKKSLRDVQAKRAAKAKEKLLTWERKKKRAETAIRKLSKQVRYYERVLN